MKARADEEGHVQPRRFSDEDMFGLLVQKGGGMPVEEYLNHPIDTKRKVHRVYKAIKLLPDRFLTSEVQDMIVKNLRVSDFQRVLKMLSQGGYLHRENDFGHRVLHTKTELAKTLNDRELAADIMSKSELMVGYPARTRPKKGRRGRGRPKKSSPHLSVVKSDLEPIPEEK